MDKEKFLKTMNEAIMSKKNFIVFVVEIPGCPMPEFIVNTTSNIQVKTSYADAAYDNEMKLKNNGDVKMIDAISANTMAEISYLILDYTASEAQYTYRYLN